MKIVLFVLPFSNCPAIPNARFLQFAVLMAPELLWWRVPKFHTPCCRARNVAPSSELRLAANQARLAPASDPLDFRLHHPLDQARQIFVEPAWGAAYREPPLLGSARASGEKRENVLTIVSTRGFRPVAS
jgi:hypothetical protein